MLLHSAVLQGCSNQLTGTLRDHGNRPGNRSPTALGTQHPDGLHRLFNPFLAEAIAVAMRGGPDAPDHGGFLDDWLAPVFGMGTIKWVFTKVPFIGQLVNAAINRFNGNPAPDKISLPPAASVLKSAVGVQFDVYKAIQENGNARTQVRDMASLVTVVTGLPAMALVRPAGYVVDVAADKLGRRDGWMPCVGH